MIDDAFVQRYDIIGDVAHVRILVHSAIFETRMNNNAGRMAYITSILVLLILLTSQIPAPVKLPSSLHVPLVAQTGENWCWAACTEMVSRYYNTATHGTAPILYQCQIVASRFTDTTFSCDSVRVGHVPAYFDILGAPFPGDSNDQCFGYTRSYTPPHGLGLPSALNVDSLESQIASGRPVIFEWSWSDLFSDSQDSLGAHWMVAEGIPYSSYIQSHAWVSILDPDPPGKGRHRIISYAEYANDKALTIPGSSVDYVFNAHGQDCYNIKFSK